MVQKKISFRKIFVFVSLIWLLAILGFFGYRLIYFNHLQNGTGSTAETYKTKLSEKLLTSLDVNNTGSGLSYDSESDSYIFKGKTKTNYVWYSGRLWRVLSINSDGSITMITDEAQTILAYGTSTQFNNSYVNKWLNPIEEKENSGIFYNSLTSPDEYLVKTNICLDIIENSTDDFKCEEINNDYYVGLLSLYDYAKRGGIDSFLNTGETFYTSNTTKEKNWYIFNEGGINTELPSIGKHYGIKPVVTLKSDIMTNGGLGTETDPYTFEENRESDLNSIHVGEYITYNNYLWRVIDKDDEKVKLIMDEAIIESIDEEESITYLEKKFSSSSNSFSTSTKSNIGYYLNNTFYNSLEDKEYLVKGNYYIGKYSNDKYDYASIFNDTTNTYIGLPAIGEMFVSNFSNTVLLSRYSSYNDLIYIINGEGKLFLNSVSVTTYVRPEIYLDATLLALGGVGTRENPFVIGRG